MLRLGSSTTRSLAMLFVLLFAVANAQDSLGLPCLIECGSFGPTHWLNAHISNRIAAGIAAPLAAETSDFLGIFDFVGGQNFPGMLGCRPRTLNFQGETATESYPPKCDLLTKQRTNVKLSDAWFNSINTKYATCRPKNSKLAMKLGSGFLVVSSTVRYSASFPKGLSMNFGYDSACRVKGIAIRDLAVASTSLKPTAAVTFAYANPVWWLPSSVRRETENAVTTQAFTYRINQKQFITALNSTTTVLTNINGVPTPSAPTVEQWSFTYTNGTRLISANGKRSSRLSPANFKFDFKYDARGRWTQVYFTNLNVQGGSPAVAASAKYSAVDRMASFTLGATNLTTALIY